jgi:hypothetical protein
VAGSVDPEHAALVARSLAAIERGHRPKDSRAFGGERLSRRPSTAILAEDATSGHALQTDRTLPITDRMLLFLAIASSALWICSCLLGLALGAMLARADGRASVGRRPMHAEARERAAVGERALPMA